MGFAAVPCIILRPSGYGDEFANDFTNGLTLRQSMLRSEKSIYDFSGRFAFLVCLVIGEKASPERNGADG